MRGRQTCMQYGGQLSLFLKAYLLNCCSMILWKLPVYQHTHTWIVRLHWGARNQSAIVTAPFKAVHFVFSVESIALSSKFKPVMVGIADWHSSRHTAEICSLCTMHSMHIFCVHRIPRWSTKLAKMCSAKLYPTMQCTCLDLTFHFQCDKSNIVFTGYLNVHAYFL